MNRHPSRPHVVLGTTVTALLLVLALAGCVGDRNAPPGPTGTTRGPDPVPSPPAEPPGRAFDTASTFDRDPCAVASGGELRAALAKPYDLFAARSLAADGPPTVSTAGEDRSETVGCGFKMIGVDTDTSETYHSVIVTIMRWKTGGSGVMATCQQAATTQPARYRTVALGDEACLGPGALMPIRIGTRYYTVGVDATPGGTSVADDELRVSTLTVAAATLVAGRLPRA